MKLIKNIYKKYKLVANFDKKYYEISYPEYKESGLSPLDHFCKIGWQRGLNPAPWFDVNRYLELHDDIKNSGQNPFTHYLWTGIHENREIVKPTPIEKKPLSEEGKKFKRIIESGYFDESYYLKSNPDVANSSISAIEHFTKYGWKENRNPSPLFDVDYFLKNFHTPVKNGENPISLFLELGAAESFIPNKNGLRPFHINFDDSSEKWQGLGSMVKEDALLDIVVPVYRGYEETLSCIYSVLTAENESALNLIVINDCSPEPEITKRLSELSNMGLFTLIENDKNLGFVKTANKGMQKSPFRDVVLLNSDTAVTDYWVDRLLYHAQMDGQVGTISPLSNNATICSYPSTNTNNNYTLELSDAELNDLIHASEPGKSIEAPTGVGFCFYIRRKLLNRIGYFDEETFALGYGEENDFCQRAIADGWKNIIAADIFVRHHGEVSFSIDAPELQQNGLKSLLNKHPAYLGEVEHFIALDPLRPLRIKHDAQRLKKALGDLAIFITHPWGGGIEKNAQDLALLLAEQGINTLFIRCADKKSEYISFDSNNKIYVPNLDKLHINADTDLIVEILNLLSPKFIHVHSFTGFMPSARAHLMRLLSQSAYPYYFTFHDYAAITPHLQLVTPDGSYIGDINFDNYDKALALFPPENGWENLAEYQQTYRDFLSQAKKIFAPSQDAADRASAFLKTKKCEFLPHPELDLKLKHKPLRKRSTNKLKIGVVGAIGLHKGRRVLEVCYRDAAARKLNLHFHLFGYLDIEPPKHPNFTSSGSYDDDERCLAMIEDYQPDFLLYLSIWPETYNYALSLAFLANIPPVVFDFGAQTERVKRHGFGHSLPLEWMNKPWMINDFLLKADAACLSREKHKELINSLWKQTPSNVLNDYYEL